MTQVIKRIHELKVGNTLTFNKQVKWTILKITGKPRGIQIVWQIDNLGNTRKFVGLYNANSEWTIDEQT